MVVTAFKLLRVCNPEYPFSHMSTLTNDVMMTHFCSKPMAWDFSKTITIKSFTDESRMYNLIMCFNLLLLSHRTRSPKLESSFYMLS